MLERKAPYVREYLFMTIWREKLDSSVQFTKSEHSSSMLLSRKRLNELKLYPGSDGKVH